MSEKILKALMQLFAIIANFDNTDEENSGRKLVEDYLKNLLSSELIEEYLQVFDHFYEIHHKKSGRKGLSANSVKILKICEDINAELRQEQKIVVLLQLLEFISSDNNCTDKELDFVKTVSDTFNFPEEEFFNAKEFMFGNFNGIPNRSKLLIINNEQTTGNSEVKHILNEKLQGNLFILFLQSTDTYLFKYIGEQNLKLNGQPIKADWSYIFDKGASIRSGVVSPIYYSDIASIFLEKTVAEKLVFTAKDIVFRFKNSENGIHKFTFSEETGRLIGIMGGSGAGKSTLLNIFNGKYQIQSGQITINGFDLHKDKEKLEGIIGFVPQDDLLIEELTVFQNLYYSAKLIFDNKTNEELEKLVEKVLKDLDLFEIRHLKVGGPLNKFISGGQRKRLNIGLELLREPPIMFVDEPTSGLSSMDSEMVMDLLKEQALKGKLIIVNIHQPSSDIYKLFDKILFLDKGGYATYYGDPLDAVTYFKKAVNHVDANISECPVCGNVNPESVLQIIETKVVDEYGKQTRKRKIPPKEWYERFVKEIDSKVKIKEHSGKIPKNDFKLPSRLKQFFIYMKRDVLAKATNKQYLLMNLLEAPLLAIILGYFTKYIAGDEYLFSLNENLPGYMFMAVVVALFLGMTVSAEEIIRDVKIQERESFLNLSRFSYINSKVVLMLFISAIQTFSFVVLANLILGIHGLTFHYWIILFTTSAFANLVGLNISAALNSVVTIYIMIPFILVPELLLSGTVVKFDKLHKSLASDKYVPLVGDLMTSRWAYEAMAVTEFKDNLYEKHFYQIDKEMSDDAYIYSSLIPNLENKITSIKNNLFKNEEPEKTKKYFNILLYEINHLGQITGKTFKKYPFTLEQLKDKKFVKWLNRYLTDIKLEYSHKRQDAAREKDKVYEQLVKELGSTDAVIKLKNDNFNENLADLVQNKRNLIRIKDGEGEMIRKIDPIFYYPENSYGRAHFYAPVKKIGNYFIDTLWFNVIFIWLTTLFMYIVLQFNWLRKLFDYFETLKLRKS